MLNAECLAVFGSQIPRPASQQAAGILYLYNTVRGMQEQNPPAGRESYGKPRAFSMQPSAPPNPKSEGRDPESEDRLTRFSDGMTGLTRAPWAASASELREL